MARPTLVIGLGGTGQWVLTYVKKELLDYYDDEFPHDVRLVAFDTSQPIVEKSKSDKKERKPGEEEPVIVEGVRLASDEFHHLGGNIESVVRDIVEEGLHKHISRWLQAKDYLTRLGPDQYNLEEGAGQMRPFGRMAVFKDLEANPEASRIFGALGDAIDGIRAGVQQDRNLEISIISSLAGGTGAGMAIDIAHITRIIAQRAIGSNFVIRGFFVLPGAFKGTFGSGNDPKMKARAFAALRELSRFQSVFGDRKYPMIYNSLESFRELREPVEKRLFDICYLVDANRPNNTLDSIPAKYGVFPSIADAIMCFIDEKSGKNHTEHLKNVTKDVTSYGDIANFSSLGTFSYYLPIRDIMGEHSYSLALNYLDKLTSPLYDSEKRPTGLSPHNNLESKGKTGASGADEFLRNPNTAEGIRGTRFLQDVVQIMEKGGSRTKALVDQYSRLNSEDLLQIIEPDETSDQTRDLRLDVMTVLVESKLRDEVKSSKELKRKPNIDTQRVSDEAESYQTGHFGIILTDGARSGGKCREALEQYEAFQIQRFRDCLAARCREILNGITRDDHITAKSGKLGFAFDFLKTLVRSFDGFVQFIRAVNDARAKQGWLNVKREEVKNARSRMSKDKDKFGLISKAAYTSQDIFLSSMDDLLEIEKEELLLESINKIGKAFLDDTIKLRDVMEQWIKALVLDPSCMYSYLGKAHSVIRSRREGYQNFEAVRRELSDGDYEALLYKQHEEEHLRKMFEKTLWDISADDFELSLKIGEKPVRLQNRETQKPVVESNSRILIEQAKSAFENLSERESIVRRLMNVFEQDDLADELEKKGGPLIHLKQIPPHSKTTKFLAVNYEQREGGETFFRDVATTLTKSTAARGSMAQLVQSQGKYKCTMVNEIDIIELQYLYEYRDLFGEYTQSVEDKRLLHCYPAEVNTVYFEQRLKELEKNYRMFKPRITFMLEHEEWVRLFVRCMVYELLKTELDEDRLPYYILELPKAEYKRGKFTEQTIFLCSSDRKPDLLQVIDTFIFLRNDFRRNRDVPIQEGHVRGALIDREKDKGSAAENIKIINSFLENELEHKLRDLDDEMKQDMFDLIQLMLNDEIDRLSASEL
ncbi:MAG: hypothetical protein GY795_18640 [Desulfobacterales bacterium]|nr:hypothetical protein [Desulfobacterales bacterium]